MQKTNWQQSPFFKQLLEREVLSVEFVKGRTNALIQRWTFNLNAAGNQTISLAGNYVYIWDASDGVANINVQFSRKDSDQDQYNLVRGLGFKHPFDKLHVSWAAQTGKTMTVLIGNLAPELFDIIDNRGSIGLTEILEELQGDTVPENMAAVPVNAAATQIVAANANRKSVMVGHRHDGVGFIYVGFSNAVTANIHIVRLAPDEYYSIDDYRGAIWAIRSAGATNAVYGEV